jgi:putative nucleotidyltransferase with HDIG domain
LAAARLNFRGVSADGEAGGSMYARKATIPGVAPATAGDLGKMAAEIERHLRSRIDDDSFPVPTMPRVVVRCLEMIRRPDISLERVAKVLETDPLLAARVVRVANSARFAGLQAATNLLHAITRLGVRELEAVFLEAAVRQLFESSDPRIAEACRGIWRHSRAVALVAREVAVLAGAGHAEDAYLAGLLHDVGKPIVAGFLIEVERALIGHQTNTWLTPASWVEIVQRSHRPVGVSLGKRWQMPEPVMAALAGCADYQPEADKSLANCVRLANQWVKRAGLYVGPMNAQEIEALVAEGIALLGLTPEQVATLGASLKDELTLE